MESAIRTPQLKQLSSSGLYISVAGSDGMGDAPSSATLFYRISRKQQPVYIISIYIVTCNHY